MKEERSRTHTEGTGKRTARKKREGEVRKGSKNTKKRDIGRRRRSKELDEIRRKEE